MAELKVLRRICDFCGEKQEFSEPTTPQEQANVSGWIVLIRMFVVNGQLYPVQKHACKDSCASNIISLGMIDLPKEIKDMLEEQRRLRKREPDQQNEAAPALAEDRCAVEA